MKALSRFSLMLLLIVVAACGSRTGTNDNVTALDSPDEDPGLEKTAIRFLETEHDFGQVKEGEKVTFKYVFENTGNADLLIRKVRATCGCTTPSWDKKPIAPGKKGTVEVVFNTKGRPGMQHKNITVTANTEPVNTIVSFVCDVLPAKENSN